MARKQLFEFEDFPWFPQLIRGYMQDHLAFMGNISGAAYQGFSLKLKEAMISLGQMELLDLCSGGGGPIQILLRLLREQGLEARAQLTDLFPNVEAYKRLAQLTNGTIKGVETPVDATNVPADLHGFRLISNGFHHFPPEAAEKILADAVNKRQGIAIVDLVNRSPLSFLGVSVGVALIFVSSLLIRPFRLSRLLLTYVAPLVPLFSLWDGLASCLRAYSATELKELVARVDSRAYEWDIGEIHFTPGMATYAIGKPQKEQG